jgi:hypothetical protein
MRTLKFPGLKQGWPLHLIIAIPMTDAGEYGCWCQFGAYLLAGAGQAACKQAWQRVWSKDMPDFCGPQQGGCCTSPLPRRCCHRVADVKPAPRQQAEPIAIILLVFLAWMGREPNTPTFSTASSPVRFETLIGQLSIMGLVSAVGSGHPMRNRE